MDRAKLEEAIKGRHVTLQNGLYLLPEDEYRMIVSAAYAYLATLPRKVPVTRWVWAEKSPRVGVTTAFETHSAALQHRAALVNPEWWTIVELTGEYETTGEQP